MNTKKILAAALALIMAFAMIACSTPIVTAPDSPEMTLGSSPMGLPSSRIPRRVYSSSQEINAAA